MKTLRELPIGKIFKVAGIKFIKAIETDKGTFAVTEDCLFNSTFGDDNNLHKSKILKRLQEEILPKIEEAVGAENVLEFETDLTTLDGLKPYEPLKSKISLPTLDFFRYREHVNKDVFEEYNPFCWWWLATPESAKPHSAPAWIVCVAPSGYFYNDYYNNFIGVRPVLFFVSDISVSEE